MLLYSIFCFFSFFFFIREPCITDLIAEGAWISQQSHTRMTGNFEIAFRYRKLTPRIEAFFFDEDIYFPHACHVRRAFKQAENDENCTQRP